MWRNLHLLSRVSRLRSVPRSLFELNSFRRSLAEFGLQTTLAGPPVRYVGSAPLTGNAKVVNRSGCGAAGAGRARQRSVSASFEPMCIGGTVRRSHQF